MQYFLLFCLLLRIYLFANKIGIWKNFVIEVYF